MSLSAVKNGTILPFVGAGGYTESIKALLLNSGVLFEVIEEFSETNQETKRTTTQKLAKSYSPGGI